MAKRRKNAFSNKKSDIENLQSSSIQNESAVNINVSSTNPDCSLDSSPCHEELRTTLFKSEIYEGKKINKKKVWKGLKQIVASERTLNWVQEPVYYGSIDAPPSFKPAKKYSDLSGLKGNYTDPHTQLRYALSDEYQTIQTLPSDIVAGYLTLRKASNPVG